MYKLLYINTKPYIIKQNNNCINKLIWFIFTNKKLVLTDKNYLHILNLQSRMTNLITLEQIV